MSSRLLDPLRFPLHGSRLIEAGAGTGKTYTIAHLYTRLVMGHGDEETAYGRPLRPSEILVVTFTEAATMELRDRIRRRLRETASFFHAGEHRPANDPNLPELYRSVPPGERAAVAQRLEQASEQMDEAAIYTIHGWCLRTLRRYAFESGVPFSLEPGHAAEELLIEAAQDYWRSSFFGLSRPSVEELSRIYPGPEQLLGTVRPLLRPHAGILRFADLPVDESLTAEAALEEAVQLRRRCGSLEDEARALWRKDRNAVVAILRETRNHLNGRKYPGCREEATFEAWLQEIDQWSAEKKVHGDPPGILRKLTLRTISENLNKGGVPPDHPWFTALQEWFDLEDSYEPRKIAAAIAVHASREISRRFSTAKRDHSLLDYDDMPEQLERALRGERGEHLAESIRKAHPVAMVDEFQDTDEMQYSILQLIYRFSDNLREHGVFLIGDPKQAIYRFRGADIHSYLLARKDTVGRHYSLGTNFRSTAPLVYAVNYLFTVASTHPRGAFLFGSGEESDVPFLPAVPQADTVDPSGTEMLFLDGQPAPPVTFWTLEDYPETISSGAYRSAMAEHAARSITGWLSSSHDTGIPTGATARGGLFRTASRERPVKPSDIAVLVRDHMEAAAIREALHRHGVAGVYLSARDSVFATPEAMDMQIWLQALGNPSSEELVRAALATATMALDLEQLERSADDEVLREEALERFVGYHTRSLRDGILPAIRALMQDYHVGPRLLATPGGERALTNVLHLAEWLHETEAATETNEELAQKLARQIVAPQEEQILRLESDGDCVRIVTVFKSKGLEYEIVVAPFVSMPPRDQLGKRSKGASLKPVRWHHEKLGRVLELCPSLSEAAGTALIRETTSEEMRLLYVAITRARHAVYLGLAPVVRGNGKKPEMHTSGIGYLLTGGEPLQSGEELYEKLRAILREPGAGDIALVPITREGGGAEVMDEATGEASGSEMREETQDPGGRVDPEESVRVATRRIEEDWWIASYSALRRETAYTAAAGRSEAPEVLSQEIAVDEGEADQEPHRRVPGRRVTPGGSGALSGSGTPGRDNLHLFPAGSRAGVFWHELLEEVARQGFETIRDRPDILRPHVVAACRTRRWEEWVETILAWIDRFLNHTFLLDLPGIDESFRFGDLTRYRTETEFLFESNRAPTVRIDAVVHEHLYPGEARPRLEPTALNGMFKGFIDLVFEYQSRYYLADWKSNRLGDDENAYHPQALHRTMREKRYDLQLALYTLALHRHLTVRLPHYSYEQHMGGGMYLFLRGMEAPGSGMAVRRIPEALVVALDDLFRDGAS